MANNRASAIARLNKVERKKLFLFISSEQHLPPIFRIIPLRKECAL